MMIGRWTIDAPGRAIPPPPPTTPKVERVLVEYDGPQWLIVSEGAQKFAAYAADEDDDVGVSRWVESPVSGVEVRAILAGRLPLRDAILKPTCRVIDYAKGRREALRSWPMSGAEIPSACLPDDDALLPTFQRVAVEFPDRAAIVFECDGPSVRDNVISFAALGEVVSALQRLWSSIGSVASSESDDGDWGNATLGFAGTRPGSFVIDAGGGGVASIEIAQRYRDLVRASYLSPSKLKAAVAAPKVHAAFRDYVAVLTSRKMDVFADWRQDGAFVGHDCAAIARSALSAPVGDAVARPGDVPVRGHLKGWMTESAEFEFYDVASATTYIGKVGKDVSGAWRVRPPTLGPTDLVHYRGVVRRKVKSGRTSHMLIQLSEVEGRDVELLSSKKT